MDALAVTAAPSSTMAADPHAFVDVPATTLPNGIVVPSFSVGQYLCSKGADGRAAVNRVRPPWTRITYQAARDACAAAGWALITELQALALAHNVALQDCNWTGLRYGEGTLSQGLHKGSVRGAQPGTYIPAGEAEMREFVLSNGEIVYDVAGNAYTWVFDDVQGDEQGLIAKAFAVDSPSIATAPFPKRTRGIGWYPDAGDNWAGDALVRGGFWVSESYAGVFVLNYVWPGDANDLVGFRCTKPIGR